MMNNKNTTKGIIFKPGDLIKTIYDLDISDDARCASLLNKGSIGLVLTEIKDDSTDLSPSYYAYVSCLFGDKVVKVMWVGNIEKYNPLL